MNIKKPIEFNKPYLSGNEIEYIRQAAVSGKISGDGIFTKKCQEFFEKKYSFHKVLLTTSCTDALELAALLIDIRPGDEVIAPSYTFVSTVNAFILRGAKIIFADCEKNRPNLDSDLIESLVSSKTKAIIAMHYAGIACDMDRINTIAKKNNLFVVEDAALSIDSYYKGKPLGSLGDISAFSFHETKNIISGEGGMIVINNEKFSKRAEIIREKGTNRSAFFRSEIDKYGWVDVGSSFLPSDIIAAFLYAQLENLERIQEKRKRIWNFYFQQLAALQEKQILKLASIPSYATNNANMFYLECRNLNERTGLIKFLKKNNINAVFHYQSLHKSDFYSKLHDGRELPMSDHYTDCLVRLPFFAELDEKQLKYICGKIYEYFETLY